MSTELKLPDKPEVRDAIFKLEDMMLKMPQADMELTHRFAPGVYMRELFIPKDVTLTGYIHKTQHFAILLSGTLILTDGDGGSVEITGPHIQMTMIGAKRVIFAKTDSRLITIHPSNETDLDKLEDDLVTNDFSEVECLVDQQDHDLVAKELGLTPEYLEEFKKLPLHTGDIEYLEIRKSPRHGMGVFVNGFVPSGAIIGPAVKDGKYMEYSRYTNHSMSPNARRQDIDPMNINIVALRDIQDEEVTMNYRDNLKVLT